MKPRGLLAGGGIAEPVRVLVMRAGSHGWALPLAHAVEIMRPLPIEPLAGLPPFVLGVSVIRGAPVPVVDAAALVGEPARSIGKLVTLRASERTVALAVESVVGVRELDRDQLAEAPPLLRGALAGVVEAVGMLDAELLLVLRAARVLPEGVVIPEAAGR